MNHADAVIFRNNFRLAGAVAHLVIAGADTYYIYVSNGESRQLVKNREEAMDFLDGLLPIMTARNY